MSVPWYRATKGNYLPPDYHVPAYELSKQISVGNMHGHAPITLSEDLQFPPPSPLGFLGRESEDGGLKNLKGGCEVGEPA